MVDHQHLPMIPKPKAKVPSSRMFSCLYKLRSPYSTSTSIKKYFLLFLNKFAKFEKSKEWRLATELGYGGIELFISHSLLRRFQFAIEELLSASTAIAAKLIEEGGGVGWQTSNGFAGACGSASRAAPNSGALAF
ncbi:hypothetical protein H5410_050493 [Solanum commersonii]|uniref:Uncharacterized protein n=1 Tax=Solanum commersonii TaxID=4109 RepID=A0A9J5WVP2_SOLCO|nr:hypothetical protein H5410_050493 [Solanum commersonii]